MTQLDTATRQLLVASQDIANCLRDIARVVLQGPREDNAGMRGGIAIGLQRAAAHVLGETLPDDGAVRVALAAVCTDVEARLFKVQQEISAIIDWLRGPIPPDNMAGTAAQREEVRLLALRAQIVAAIESLPTQFVQDAS